MSTGDRDLDQLEMTFLNLQEVNQLWFIYKRLRILEGKIDNIMAKQEDFDAVLGRIDTATNKIAADLIALRDQIKGAGLPEALENSILASLTEKAARLEAIGADPTEPVPGG